ncbi:hypothetical protein DOY81_010529, partial [Sarcophaga bullata]
EQHTYTFKPLANNFILTWLSSLFSQLLSLL